MQLFVLVSLSHFLARCSGIVVSSNTYLKRAPVSPIPAISYSADILATMYAGSPVSCARRCLLHGDCYQHYFDPEQHFRCTLFRLSTDPSLPPVPTTSKMYSHIRWENGDYILSFSNKGITSHSDGLQRCQSMGMNLLSPIGMSLKNLQIIRGHLFTLTNAKVLENKMLPMWDVEDNIIDPISIVAPIGGVSRPVTNKKYCSCHITEMLVFFFDCDTEAHMCNLVCTP